MFPFNSVVCLAGVLSLAPLVLYLLWLSLVARRSRPTIVSGPWDFVGVLAGLSGFILFGGGLLLALMQSNFRFLFRGNFEALRDAWAKEHLWWVLTVIAYLGFVVGGAYLALMARRRSFVVYNVEPDHFEAALSEVFEHLGHPVERRGNLWVGGIPLCEVEPGRAGHTATLRWLADDPLLFQEVERHLREALGTLSPGDNPAARWISFALVATGSVLVFLVFLLFYIRFRR
ncbi:MAG TPA: hypothetical protein VN641_19315 [Urbifossiella sp.]|nr:hypothetical protein [Urbifossiella sp.]